MADALKGCRLKIGRAEQHLRDLHGVCQPLMRPGRDAFTYTDFPERGQRFYHLKREPEIPDVVAILTGDAIQNLRTALDHLAFSLYLTGPKKGVTKDLHRLYFPIGSSANEFPQQRDQSLRGFWRSDAVAALNAIEPYGGGKGDILHVLSKLNVTDKHRLLLTVAASTGASDLGSFMFEDMRSLLSPEKAALLQPSMMAAFFKPADVDCPLKASDPFVIEPLDRLPNPHYQGTLDIAIYEPKILKCQPVLPLLQQMVDFINGTVIPELGPFALPVETQ